MRKGGIGVIEEGNLKGRQFIIPNLVLVEKGKMGDATEYSMACIIHHKFLSSSTCQECDAEVTEKIEQNKAIGLA